MKMAMPDRAVLEYLSLVVNIGDPGAAKAEWLQSQTFATIHAIAM